MAKRTQEQPTEDWSYETAIARIETTVTELEQGELPLADIFEQFEQAVTELRRCEAFLTEKQQQATVLIETLTIQESGDGG
ncbi:MAG: exodeoxyribonuclease VII small subunit [Cyanobacteria bacterium]|nr:exodeoxyribonuclease VII small subunit [Cyanobacteriota bacterium]